MADSTSNDQPKKTKRRGKAHRDAEKARRKAIENGDDLEIQHNPNEVIPVQYPAKSSEHESAHKSVKRKRNSQSEEDAVISQPTEIAGTEEATTTKAPNSKRQKKSKGNLQQTNLGEDEQNTKKSAVRFIVFVGNLPFNATSQAISKHFSAVKPTSIRLISDQKTGKGKGFAFLEFDRYDRMKSCLKSYHHSIFYEDGSGGQVTDQGQDIPDHEKTSSSKPGRKINVELTAGGGGSSEHRREKLKAKNEKLKNQRKNRIGAEKSKKNSKATSPSKKEVPQVSEMKIPDSMDSGIHPSRLAMMK